MKLIILIKGENNMLKKLCRNESGQTIVLVALMMVMLIGFGALTIDVGAMTFQRSNLQNAADSAALAGIQNLPSAGNVKKAAIDYARSNGIKVTENGAPQSGDTIAINTPYKGDSTKVEVIITRQVRHYLAGILGLTQSNISARAVAQKNGKVGGPAFHYAIFSGNPNYTLAMSGNSYVLGDIHTNYRATMSGNADINGSVEAVSTFNISGNTNITGTVQASSISQSGNSYIGNPIQSPSSFVDMIPDFSDKIKMEADAAGTMQYGNVSISGNTTMDTPIFIKGNLTISGNTTFTFTSPIYVDGNITISGNYTYPGSCIYATGHINLSGNNSLTDKKVLVYSKNKDITISGNSSPSGIIFAPNGTISISGNSINGRVIADKVSLSGNYNVVSGADDFDCLPEDDSIKLIE
jgi:cytoskeletal protein CcmA (bactofilin family)